MAMGTHRVWIEAGCIHCYWCSDLAPAIFLPGDAGSRIASSVRQDGTCSDNRGERSPLRSDLIPPADLAFLPFIADGCPAQVIHLEGDWSVFGVADPALQIPG